jgi:hypothetical protein
MNDSGLQPWIKTYYQAGAVGQVETIPDVETSRVTAKRCYTNQYLRKFQLANVKRKLLDKLCLMTITPCQPGIQFRRIRDLNLPMIKWYQRTSMVTKNHSSNPVPANIAHHDDSSENHLDVLASR